MRTTFLDKKDNKNSIQKKTILRLCITGGEHSIATLSEQLNASVPTVTKLIGELMDEGFMVDLGKQGTSGGRKPSLYGLNPDAGYFIGVDLRHSHASIAVTDFKGGLVSFEDNITFHMEREEASVHKLATAIRLYAEQTGLDWNRVLGMGISVAGRVNPETGYSNHYSFDPARPVNRILEEDLEIPVVIENDSRAMSYGEYLSGAVNRERNVLVVNVSWGLGMGLILDGKLYYGASGFSGEFGHFPLLNNDKICRCGKVGCLETAASGYALTQNIIAELKAGRASSLSAKYRREGKVNLNDIFQALREEDVLAIEQVEAVGANLGRGLAGLINVFNPELVVIGGKLAVAGDYLMLPIQSAVRRYAQNIAIQDTRISFSRMGNKAAPMGASLLCRSRILRVL